MKTLLRLRVVPNARRTEVVGKHGGAVKIKVQAPATDGKANEALRDFLAERLQVPARAIEFAAGEKSRDKTLAVAGLDAGQVHRRLLGLSA